MGDDTRRRAMDLGLHAGSLEPGPLNAITDVTGIRVGQITVIEGVGIRTGVTAVVPDALDRAGGMLAAGLFVGNGFGKLTGATQLAELGMIETPVVLTGTLSTFRAADAIVTYMLALPGNEGMLTVNPVVGETNDGYLSDIRARPVTERHVLTAIRGARGGPVGEGAVGAGTGTAALGFKAGIGTSSRLVTPAGRAGSTGALGVLVQSNFSGTLTVRGVRIGAPGHGGDRAGGAPDGGQQGGGPGGGDRAGGRPGGGQLGGEPGGGPRGNSCMIVVATDHGLDARQLGRVARRAVFAMGRTGADFAGTSGDYAIAFAAGSGPSVPDDALGPFFAAVQDAVEEAILNSLFMATTMTGFEGHVRHAVALDVVTAACAQAGVLGRP
jgi:D-aminopeptidase